MKWFKEQGWEVHVAARGDMELPFIDKKYQYSDSTIPFHTKNVKAYQELKKIIDQNQYKIIHCHTPMGGVLARLAAREARKKDKGNIYSTWLSFLQWSSIINWLLYYPIEKWLARYTDC